MQPERQAKDDLSPGLRAPSVIQLDRQERLRRKIQREQGKDAETVARRNTKYDDKARSQL